ncbi:DUF3526 domain-containing protein [Variovorax sp. J31P207]|uniref:DUF3526 domain-containing protein n=1 Tax=Variovorax sp. J31P207 TaxID=3053510 RepID=UPI002578CD5F|nr:DUF3526 domain-containing protein [Variovorax sp. J31P207]MDM0072324.1 DUF3526 domain-containing protein [Variovorax sp. J31P207]
MRERHPAQEPLPNLKTAAVSPPARVVEQAVIEDFRLVSRNPNVNVWTPARWESALVRGALAALVDFDRAEITLRCLSMAAAGTILQNYRRFVEQAEHHRYRLMQDSRPRSSASLATDPAAIAAAATRTGATLPSFRD